VNFVRNLSIFTSSRVFSALILLAIGVITARILGPEGRGFYAIFFTIVGLAANTMNLGLSQANTYLLNREKLAFGTLAGNTLLFLLVLAAGLAGIVAVLADTAGEALAWGGGEKVGGWWWLLWAAIIFTLLESSFSGLVYGSHLYLYQSKSYAVQAVLFLIATLLIIPLGESLDVALWLRVVAMALFVSWYVLMFWRQVSLVNPTLSIAVFIRQIQFGSRNWLQNLIGLLNYRGYILLLGAISSPEAIGVFSIALLMAEVIRFIPDTVATLLLPKLVGMEVGRDANEMTALVCRVIIFTVLLLASGLFFMADCLIPMIFGNDYLAGVTVLRILLVGAVLGVVYQVLTRYFTSEAKQIYSIYSALIALGVAIVVSLLLIPEYGAEGAAAAFTVSSLAASLSMLVMYRRYTGISVVGVVVMRKPDWLLCWGYLKGYLKGS